MALEAVVFSQDPFNYGCKDFCSLVEALGGGGGGGERSVGTWGHDNLQVEERGLMGVLFDCDSHIQNGANLHVNWDCSSSSVLQNVKDQCHWETNSSPEACTVTQPSLSPEFPPLMETVLPSTGRRKRRRTRSTKNKEEIENQRMTHIAVERNRRKQMNEYLAVLRSLMPPSYVQRGDQASIIGGAINFVKELEQLLQSMEGHRKSKQQPKDHNGSSSPPFSEFFSFPQYSTRSATHRDSTTSQANATTAEKEPMNQSQNQNHWAVADIEVTMVDSHANLKILSKKRPRQLLKMVVGFQSLRLSILHLNVTIAEEMVLYSVSVKLEEGCQLNTVDEIAASVNELLSRIIQEEAASSLKNQ